LRCRISSVVKVQLNSGLVRWVVVEQQVSFAADGPELPQEQASNAVRPSVFTMGSKYRLSKACNSNGGLHFGGALPLAEDSRRRLTAIEREGIVPNFT